MRLLIIASLCLTASAWTVSSRRDAIKTMVTGVVAVPVVANALDACPPKAQNCVRATWTPPSGTDKKASIAAVKSVIDAYPQEGQGDVDGGGWSIAESFDGGSGRVEFKSSGKGNLARFFNGGKPFTDDFTIEVEDSGVVQIKSQSRVGDSDFGVNAKRVDYLAAALAAKGWTV
eukprot:CAMPEP_0194028198 /NCGR_PEP_ID=MMETSP0009_2-20130614/2232_1 /TAXON_ID=210454 /ORGANISM="Grammatophora oceanica, Strain CCMP 410" /LENGTH=173 /DNA_ID=CAMNT_0038667521 /DNA_START=107 /DNA_END=628 /DNA_ORIENTATION=+